MADGMLWRRMWGDRCVGNPRAACAARDEKLFVEQPFINDPDRAPRDPQLSCLILVRQRLCRGGRLQPQIRADYLV